MSLTRREELQRLTVKNGLRPIARNFQIRKYSSMNKNILIDSILDFERNNSSPILDNPIPESKLYKSCRNCEKTNFITCVNVIICKYCCTPYGYI